MTAQRGEADGGVPGEHGTHHHPWPPALSRLERRGMLYGPLGYAKSRARLAARGTPGAPTRPATDAPAQAAPAAPSRRQGRNPR